MKRPAIVIVLAALLGLVAGAGFAAADLLGSSTPAAAQSQAGSPITAPGSDDSVGQPTEAPSTPAAEPVSDPPTPAPAEETPSAAPKVLWALNANGTKVREVEARLAQLGLEPTRWVDGHFGTTTRDAVERFQEHAGLDQTGTVDEVTWDRLQAATKTPTHAELYSPAARPTAAGEKRIKLDPRCATGRALCIDKTTRTLAWVVDGKIQMTLDVRFGSAFHPTREGQFSVYWKSRDHVSTLYGSKMPYAMFFSGGEAVHYSSDFAARGYAGASHGCVNVRDRAGLASLFDQVHVGDKVVVYRG
jgi:peptidoglycan hydrolase-like protein with peptidoglycan-binding domain